MSAATFTSEITVQLLQHVGDDVTIARAAWVSTLGAATPPAEDECDGARIEGLLRYLMKHRHGSPFEHGSMTFRVHAPLFVFREWHRHRIGWSYNEESARYHQLEPVFWIPQPGRKLITRPDSRASRPMFGGATVAEHDETVCRLRPVYAAAYAEYRALLKMGVDPGAARACLPVGIYSSMWATCNPRSLLAFLSLRTHEPSATFVSYPLQEIEDAARQMEQQALQHWPITLKLFDQLGRVAP